VTALATASTRAAAEQWVLVLASQRISSKLERGPEGWAILVGARDAEAAARALAAYERENPDPVSAQVPRIDYGRTWAGFAMAALLVAFFGVTGPRDPAVFWFREGSASAELILRGELWRMVTALTLHADLGHVLANAVSCALFATAVCWSMGPGVGWCLIILAGAGGNGLNALVHASGHSSVGASTAIFGAVGLLTGLQLVRRRRLGFRGRRAWAPIAAGLALLAMLGTGKGSDLSAHLLGFLCGAVLGVVAVLGMLRAPARGTQSLLLLCALAAVVYCWHLALS
jgi:membrane associated rhomboid family serine protease